MRGPGSLLAVLFACAVMPATAEELIPVSAYACLPQLSGFDVSPSGKRVLMFQPAGDALHLVVMDLEARTSRLALASDPDRFFFNWCVFDADDRIVCSVRAYIELVAVQNSAFQLRRYKNSRAMVTRLFAVDPDGGNFIQLVPDSVTRADEQFVYNPQQQDRIVSWLPDDPDHVLIQLARTDPNLPDVYKLDTRKNKLVRVVKHRAPILSWDASEAGTVLLGTGLSGSDPVAFVRDRGNFRQRPIQASVASDVYPGVLGFAADDRIGYVAMDAGDGRRAVYAVDTTDLHTTATVFADPQFDVFPTLMRDPRTRQPVGVIYQRDEPTVVWFDTEWRQRFEDIAKALPRATNVPISWSRDGNVVVLVSTQPSTVPTYYLYNATAKKLVKFGTGYPEIPPASVVERRPVRYTARDGTTIPAYLAVPPGDAKHLPTIIFPHGGPYARDPGGFDYWVQFFVSRGYAVLQPNFRGSTGYGTAFMRAGYEQWGEKMQDDVIDGLDWLIAQGITDPSRACVVGGSYGGYVALVAAYKTPQKFRCAVDFAGVADLNAMVTNLWQYRFGELTRVRIQRGEALSANSPIEHVADIGIPLLIVHGDQDRSVFIEQSVDLDAALQAAGKPHQFILQPGGDHYLSRASQRLQLFEAMDAFLREHLPVQQTPPPPS